MGNKPRNPADMKGIPDPSNRIDWDAFVKHMLSECKPFLLIDYDAVSSIPVHLRDAYIKCVTEGRVYGGDKTQ